MIPPPPKKTLCALHYYPIEATFPTHPFYLNKIKCAYLYEFFNIRLECLTWKGDFIK